MYDYVTIIPALFLSFLAWYHPYILIFILVKNEVGCSADIVPKIGCRYKKALQGRAYKAIDSSLS